VEKPFQIFIDIPEDAKDQRTSNLVFETQEVQVYDASVATKQFTLDTTGFMFRKHNTRVLDFTDKFMVEEVYLPEMEALLKQEVEGVDRVFFFDWRIRKGIPEIEGTTIDLNDLTNWLRPITHIHVDQSPAAVVKRVRIQIPSDADFLLKGRVRVINLWKPLIDRVEDWPLAVCDGSTVDKQDLVETDHVRRHYTGSTMYLKYGLRQKFYYFHHQSKEDILIFKNFDSDPSAKARYAPHTSFRHPACPINAIPRKSVEVRALVFTFPQIENTKPPRDLFVK
jgi:hypothetical protein